MSAGHARSAIRAMVTVPRRGRRWSQTRWIAASVLTVGIAALAKLVGRVWAWVVIATTIGFGLGAIPLFGVLGYELAFAMTFVAAIMGLDLGSALARELQRMRAPGISRATYAGRTLARSTLAAALLPATILLVPALIAAVRGLWLPTCDWSFGVEAYLIMPITTALLAGATGHAIAVLVQRAQPAPDGETAGFDLSPRPSLLGRVWRGVTLVLPFVPAIGVAVFAVWRFLGAPPVFTYNAILGYFPGNLYDENVQLTAALYWSRLEQALGVIAFVAFVALWLDVPSYRATRGARPAGRRFGVLAVAIVAAIGAAFLRYESGDLGYAIDGEDIEVALSGRIETEHFIIHYAKGDQDVEEVIGLVVADHEFRYAQVVERLGISSSEKIRSFYFADRDQKARWMGARDVEMAKPWRREIYLEHRGFPHGSLRHEIAHAVASEFGDRWFGVAAKEILCMPLDFVPGLIEGLAVAADWPGGYDRMTPHESVRALQAMGKQPAIGALFSYQFFSLSSQTSYTTAGSFLKFLLDKYGAERLRGVYGTGGAFDAAYGKPLAALEAEWREMISSITLPPDAVEASRERFRVGSVFQRPCPHAIAAQRERAQRVLASGDRRAAIEIMRDVCKDAPEEPRYRMDLAEMLGAGTDRERDEATTTWSAIVANPERVTSTIRAEAYERLARIAAARNDFTEVGRLIAEAIRLPLGDQERRQLDALAFALAHRGPAGPALRGYFFGGAAKVDAPTWALLATLAEPSLGFGHYLRGLQHLARGELGFAAASLDRGLALGLPGLPFVKNGARRLAVASYRTGDTIRLLTAIAALSGSQMSTGDKLLAKDWYERIAFDARRK